MMQQRNVCTTCRSFDEGHRDPVDSRWYCRGCSPKTSGYTRAAPVKGTIGRDSALSALDRLMNLTTEKARPVHHHLYEDIDLGAASRAGSLVSRLLRPINPIGTAPFPRSLSPRGAGTGRPSTRRKLPIELLLTSADDIVSQIYLLFDEDMTKVILNSLDTVTSSSTEDARSRSKMRAVDELVQLLGDEHYNLIRILIEKARDVFIKLLEEFCTLEESQAPRQPNFGSTVRFVQADKKTERAATADERWLKHMNRRYCELVAESELDMILRRDFSVSGSAMPSNMTVVKQKDNIRCHLPPPELNVLPVERRISVKTSLPQWSHVAFGSVTHLNTLQTHVFDTMFHTSQNMLICAPTGAGKTIVALLSMLRLIQEHFIDGVLNRDFKMIFVAPMKALAQEMVENFRKRLSPYQLVVRELTGDMQLTKKEISETQLIVTTPEKWDVVTRKQGDNDLVKKTKLIVLDEIHLLNDERGPVIEAIVARTLRHEEADPSNRVRLVGLSATLPNHKDVARFLNVDLEEGLKVFGPEYRPVPLEQTFIGTQETSRAKEAAIDRLTFQEVLDNLKRGYQVMVFVHSRKQTISLGKYFMEEAKREHLEHHFSSDLDRETLKRGNLLQGRDLSDLFRFGVCCHHAGMTRYDRTAVEGLFRDSKFKVLICTATLAWGVNLPAHTVIIRGTEVYDPKRGGFVSISVLDVMQIFGRAGRPQYDTSGHGVIISDVKQINHYLRLIAHALPIESKMQTKLCDHLNAEIHAGTISSIPEALKWLEYTYMWQRMRVNPLCYGFTIADVRRDPELKTKRYELIADAAKSLAEAGMIRNNPDTGNVDTTDLGRIASHYYIECESIKTFNEMMRNPDETFKDTIDMNTAMDIAASANEFSQLRVRQDELDELQKINSLLPPRIQKRQIVGESADATSVQAKVTTLLKAYISGVGIESHSLTSDMNYVVQNVPRIARALFEIEAQRCHPNSTGMFLTLCKCVERRCWEFEHPLAQFGYDFTDSVLRHLNESRPSMETLQEMSEREIGSLVHNIRFGGIIKRLVAAFPSLRIDADVQPITRTILRVKCTLTPTFTWENKYHGGAEPFWLFVEDQDNNYIFHQEMILVNRKHTTHETPLVVNFTVPIRPEYGMYSIRVYSDRWVGSMDEFPISIDHLQLPDDTHPTTKLQPMEPLSRDVIPQSFHPIYQGFTQLNSVQSQVFFAMHHTDHNVFLGAPTGSGKTVAAEMAMLRVLSNHAARGKVVYVAPLKALVKERMGDWVARFQKKLDFKVVELSGDVTPDIAALAQADILCTTPEKWDGISRNWQVRSYVKAVRLVVFDEIHMLGTDRGPILEVIVSRMRYIGWHQGAPIRLVGLSTAVANPGDLAAWLGVDKPWCLFNFEPSVRPVPMRVHIAGYPGRHYCPRMATMNKPTYNAIVEKSPDKPVIVFVSSRRQTRLTAMALISFVISESNTAKFVRMTVEELVAVTARVQDAYLKHSIQFGIGIHHAGLNECDKQVVEDSFRKGKLQILVATSTLAWGVNFPAHMVVVKGTEFYDGKTKTYVDFPITDVLQMVGRAGRPQFDNEGVAQVLCHEPKKGFYRKFLYEPFPVESALHKQLHVHMNAEIVAGTISTRQDAVDYLTWTFLFRRLVKNPSFYGLEDRSPKAVTVFLSGLVRKILFDLERAGCLETPDADDEEADPNALQFSVLGKLCSYYYLSHTTAQHFDEAMESTTSHEELLALLCGAQEFAELPVRHNEDKLNLDLAQRVPLAVDIHQADSPHVKANLLFQAHYSRSTLPISDYLTDQRSALDNSVRVIQAMVDVAANSGHLYTAMRAMSLMQCMVQARWWYDNTLLQIPHVTAEMLQALSALGLSHLAQVVNASAETLRSVRSVMVAHGATNDETEEAMYIIRRLPVVDVQLALTKENNETFVLTVDLTRLSVPASYVHAPKFSKPKDEQYWVAVGNESTGELVALKRINRLTRRASTQLRFDWDDDWEQGGDVVQLSVFVVCDSFLGLDQSYSFDVRRMDD